jgi:hypothetical protein
MLLNRTTLALAKLASTEESRYTLNAIHVEPEVAVVTNGHYLVAVTNPTPAPCIDNYPVTPGLEHKFVEEAGVLVSRDAALAALKALPGQKRHGNIPILQNAAMGADGKLYVNDLENVSAFKHEVEGRFPNWRMVMPKGEPVAEICMSAQYLVLLGQYLAAQGDVRCASIRLTLYGPHDPMRFDGNTPDGQKIMAILMPTKDGKEFAARPHEVARLEAEAAVAKAYEKTCAEAAEAAELVELTAKLARLEAEAAGSTATIQ